MGRGTSDRPALIVPRSSLGDIDQTGERRIWRQRAEMEFGGAPYTTFDDIADRLAVATTWKEREPSPRPGLPEWSIDMPHRYVRFAESTDAALLLAGGHVWGPHAFDRAVDLGSADGYDISLNLSMSLALVPVRTPPETPDHAAQTRLYGRRAARLARQLGFPPVQTSHPAGRYVVVSRLLTSCFGRRFSDLKLALQDAAGHAYRDSALAAVYDLAQGPEPEPMRLVLVAQAVGGTRVEIVV